MFVLSSEVCEAEGMQRLSFGKCKIFWKYLGNMNKDLVVNRLLQKAGGQLDGLLMELWCNLNNSHMR